MGFDSRLCGTGGRCVTYMQRLAQTVADASTQEIGRVGRRVAGTARAALVKARDPTIVFAMGPERLYAPLSHELPRYLHAHPRYARNVTTIAQLVGERHPRPTMIDIGANIGDTAVLARVAVPDLPILCIEGDQRYAELLRANVGAWSNVEIEAPCLLGDKSGTIGGALNTSNGTGTFVEDGEAESRIEQLDHVLRRYPRFASPSLIKSDTDGFEARILAGASDTLERSKPVLFVEYDPDLLARAGSVGLKMLADLRDRGYGPTVVYDNFGDLLMLADLRQPRVLADLDRYTRQKPSFYLDLALFPADQAADAEELHAREASPAR
jgi:FkbM family methyltransferase